jgi:hypothetical protein
MLCNECVSGFGVFAAKRFEKGDFLLDYAGELMDPKVADNCDRQDYIFFFRLAGKQYW